jgi:hypothetical protein
MNQALLFNDDLTFNNQENTWCLTAQLSGQVITVYFHSLALKKLTVIDNSTKFDLEDSVELWLEKHELEGDTIHIEMQ